MDENSVEKSVRPQNKYLTPMKKGETLNPNGRPLGQKNYATIYREAMIMLADKNATTPEKLEAEMIANAAVLARKGDYRFYKDLMDRQHGTAISRSENINLNASVEKLPPEEKERLSSLLHGESQGT